MTVQGPNDRVLAAERRCIEGKGLVWTPGGEFVTLKKHYKVEAR